MLNKSLSLAVTIFTLWMGASCHAATMSSESADSGIFAPPTTFVLDDDSQPGEVTTQASAYFAAPTGEESADDGFITVEDEERKRRKGAMAWTSSAFMLGSFFLVNSALPDQESSSIPLVPGPEVAPVPELNSGALVLMALGGMGLVTLGRRRLVQNNISSQLTF